MTLTRGRFLRIVCRRYMMQRPFFVCSYTLYPIFQDWSSVFLSLYTRIGIEFLLEFYGKFPSKCTNFLFLLSNNSDIFF